ncbi:hypothetical protein C6503_20675 [Candidatus Poribacteria bacterium]|nr:MAG: hypothetical protein C6503_20675 [Candidatus Poribacteria bacterium]
MNLMKQEESAKQSTALELISQLFGPAVGFVVGDHTGISAAAVSVITKWGLDRFVPILISKRQTVRLFQWGIQAAEGVTQRLANGEKFRDDGFFEETPTSRSDIDEVVESTLKKVMDTTEEPKIKFMANLTENVHFDSDFDIDTYRRILRHLEELSYRQLCIMKLFINADRIDLDSLGKNVTPNLSSILADCIEVRDKGFIDSNNPLMKRIGELYLGSSGQVRVSGGTSPPEYPGFDHHRANILDENMFKFAKLDQIPDEDVDVILRELRAEPTGVS